MPLLPYAMPAIGISFTSPGFITSFVLISSPHFAANSQTVLFISFLKYTGSLWNNFACVILLLFISSNATGLPRLSLMPTSCCFVPIDFNLRRNYEGLLPKISVRCSFLCTLLQSPCQKLSSALCSGLLLPAAHQR